MNQITGWMPLTLSAIVVRPVRPGLVESFQNVTTLTLADTPCIWIYCAAPNRGDLNIVRPRLYLLP